MGGVGSTGVIPHEDEILVCNFVGAGLQLSERITIPTTEGKSDIPRPLIVGSSVAQADNGHIVIIGGGATCFSMGTFCMWLLPPLHGTTRNLALALMQFRS